VADHITEEEQIEALKRWWEENGKQTILAIVLVVGGYFGWQTWTDYNAEQASAASLTYQEMLDNFDSLNPGETLTEETQIAVNLLADKLKAEYSGTQYAVYAALTKAKLAVEANDLDAAVSELQWAMDNADEVSAFVARLRLARVEAARGDLDKALQLVQGIDAGEMKSAFEEAKGDFYLEQGNSAAAYTAYQSALAIEATGDNSVRALLELKIGLVQPVEPEEPATEQ
jgi:predicted negative regulator of RcsB-dependent stress response